MLDGVLQRGVGKRWGQLAETTPVTVACRLQALTDPRRHPELTNENVHQHQMLVLPDELVYPRRSQQTRLDDDQLQN